MALHFEELVAPLLFCLLAASSAAVVRSPTNDNLNPSDNPCQVDRTSTGTPVYLPIKDQIQLTITAANTADTKCQQFKEALNSVLVDDDIRQLDLPVHNVSGLPLARNDSALNAANIVNSFNQDYQEISTYIMHLQFIKYLVAVDSGMFSEKIDSVMDQFHSWLCSIDNILRSQNNLVTPFVNNTAVNEQVKLRASKGSKNGYSFYYLVLKNAHDFIQNKLVKWNKYQKEMK